MVFYFTSNGAHAVPRAIRMGFLLLAFLAAQRLRAAAVSPPAFIYMGRDKFENEELIKYGWPEDVWFAVSRVPIAVERRRFHVDDLSSAHVYLRLAEVWLGALSMRVSTNNTNNHVCMGA